MKKIAGILFMAVMLFALQGCKDNDEPTPTDKYVDPEAVAGLWFATNIRGWEYDEDAPKGKREFSMSFRYNDNEDPVGANAEDAVVIYLVKSEHKEGPSEYFYVYSSYSWNWYYRQWEPEEGGFLVKLKGDKLDIAGDVSTITEINETTMTLYQKDSDGEYWVTFTRHYSE